MEAKFKKIITSIKQIPHPVLVHLNNAKKLLGLNPTTTNKMFMVLKNTLLGFHSSPRHLYLFVCNDLYFLSSSLCPRPWRMMAIAKLVKVLE